jgi:DnaJ-domain-containing protein 1
MSEAAFDPYAVLGVAPDISDVELRRVYRALVKRHHPDHNGGSAESARRFAQIQNAYAAIAQRRRGPQATPTAEETSGQQAQAPSSGDPYIENRIASMEREMAAAREAEQRRAQEQARLVREQAAKVVAARRAQASQGTQSHRLQPTPEELGYYTTDDSFTKIIDDATEQLGERLHKSDAKKQFARRLSDLFGRDD